MPWINETIAWPRCPRCRSPIALDGSATIFCARCRQEREREIEEERRRWVQLPLPEGKP